MPSGFRRSVSLPVANPNFRLPNAGKVYHVRSASLPCRSHPLVSQLEDEVRATREWQSTGPEGHHSSAWLGAGLIRLELLHLALDGLLQLPKTREILRRNLGGSSSLADRLLDDFLLFADSYGSFRSALVSLHELQSAAQVAVRRRDEAQLASVARSLRKAEKEVSGLSCALRSVSRSAEPLLVASLSGSTAAEAELAGILRKIECVTVSVSATVFQRTAAALASVTAAVVPKSSSWTALRRKLTLTSFSKKKGSSEETDEGEAWAKSTSEKLDRLGECVSGLETGSERVLRSLMNTRVSLLNMSTP